jgi:hypothetical protein
MLNFPSKYLEITLKVIKFSKPEENSPLYETLKGVVLVQDLVLLTYDVVSYMFSFFLI